MTKLEVEREIYVDRISQARDRVREGRCIPNEQSERLPADVLFLFVAAWKQHVRIQQPSLFLRRISRGAHLGGVGKEREREVS